jgi:hypothetical protein
MTKIASISFMGGSVFFGAKFDQNAQNKNIWEYFVAIFCFLGEKASKFENKSAHIKSTSSLLAFFKKKFTI